ncbi:MAG: EamA family transporter [Candidatus Eisenbacteria bacterium]|nr:EamA family transporter [Candidatus Eisenbacteria bacterium]
MRETARSSTFGSLLIIGSAVSFGFLAFFAAVARARGIGTETLLFLRFALAAVILIAVTAARRERWPGPGRLLALVAMGAIGYVGEALCYFKALELIPAGLVALLLYLYPGLVALLSRAFYGTKIDRTRGLALALAMCGTLLTIGPVGGGNAKGILLGIGSAVLYSAYIVAGVKVTRGVPAMVSTTVVCASAAVSYGLLLLRTGPTWPRTFTDWAPVLGISLISTVVAILLLFAGLSRVGPVRTSTLSTLEALTTVLVGALLMGERLAPLQWFGGGLILAAAVFLTRQGGGESG